MKLIKIGASGSYDQTLDEGLITSFKTFIQSSETNYETSKGLFLVLLKTLEVDGSSGSGIMVPHYRRLVSFEESAYVIDANFWVYNGSGGVTTTATRKFQCTDTEFGDLLLNFFMGKKIVVYLDDNGEYLSHTVGGATNDTAHYRIIQFDASNERGDGVIYGSSTMNGAGNYYVQSDGSPAAATIGINVTGSNPFYYGLTDEPDFITNTIITTTTSDTVTLVTDSIDNAVPDIVNDAVTIAASDVNKLYVAR